MHFLGKTESASAFLKANLKPYSHEDGGNTHVPHKLEWTNSEAFPPLMWFPFPRLLG